MEVEEEGQREKEGLMLWGDRLLAQQLAGPQTCHPQHWNVSYRQPEAVLLFLPRFEGCQSAEVLLHVGLLHLVIS